jgi:hypothetical protein
MSTMTHGPDVVHEQRRSSLPVVPELWASGAIAVIWIAVLCTAIWGGNIVNNDAGGNQSTVPTVVVVAIFAFLGTWVVAKYGFRRPKV